MAAPSLALAGIFELGLTANYRSSQVTEDNSQASLSYTGSISYYFFEMSALELSYTNGNSVLSYRPSASDPKTEITTEFEMMGVDLVLTFAGRDAAFQPYVKVGGAHISKKIVIAGDQGTGSAEIKAPDGIVPSAGIGVKIKLTEQFLIKAGVDAWTSPLNDDAGGDDATIDFAGRAGISIYL